MPESPLIVASNRAQNVMERYKALASLVTQLRAGTSPYKGFDATENMRRHSTTFNDVVTHGANSFVEAWKKAELAERDSRALHTLFESELNNVVGRWLFTYTRDVLFPSLNERVVNLYPQQARAETFSSTRLPMPENLQQEVVLEEEPQAEELPAPVAALDVLRELVRKFVEKEEFVAHERLTHAVGNAVAAVNAAEALQAEVVRKRKEELRKKSEARARQQEAARAARAAEELAARRAADEAVANEMLALICA